MTEQEAKEDISTMTGQEAEAEEIHMLEQSTQSEEKLMHEQSTQSDPIEEIKITHVYKNKASQTSEQEADPRQNEVPPL